MATTLIGLQRSSNTRRSIKTGTWISFWFFFFPIWFSCWYSNVFSHLDWSNIFHNFDSFFFIFKIQRRSVTANNNTKGDQERFDVMSSSDASATCFFVPSAFSINESLSHWHCTAHYRISIDCFKLFYMNFLFFPAFFHVLFVSSFSLGSFFCFRSVESAKERKRIGLEWRLFYMSKWRQRQLEKKDQLVIHVVRRDHPHSILLVFDVSWNSMANEK